MMMLSYYSTISLLNSSGAVDKYWRRRHFIDNNNMDDVMWRHVAVKRLSYRGLNMHLPNSYSLSESPLIL